MMNSNLLRAVFKHFCLLVLLVFAQQVFAAIPIQGGLQGAAAADARFAVISAAESFLGTPYRYSGIDRKGIDCSGLVYMSFREALNITIPRSSEAIYNWAEKISTSELQPGDLVFFITTGRNVSHLGIYIGGGNFIHSASEGPSTGVIYSNLDESYWKRTYHGAGRALPWDKTTAEVMEKGVQSKPRPASTKVINTGEGDKAALLWTDPGFFLGFGAAWNWGGFIEGSDSVFRGLSFLATAGYKWSKLRFGIELRPEWDRSLDVFRLPITVSFGNEYLQVFGGPAITFGHPSLTLSNGEERSYSGGGEWRWELGVSFSWPLIKIKSGALAVYGDLAWQPYHWGEGEDFSFKPDFTANFRFSTGFRYLWHFL